MKQSGVEKISQNHYTLMYPDVYGSHIKKKRRVKDSSKGVTLNWIFTLKEAESSASSQLYTVELV
jgi:hypothetical protein